MLQSVDKCFPWLLLAIALGATVFCYGPGLGGGFAFDDYPNIVRNPQLAGATFSAHGLLEAALSSDSGPLARPLAMLSFAVQTASSGLSPYPLKVGNLIIHLANGVLVFLLCRVIVQISASQGVASTRRPLAVLLPCAVSAAWLLAPINLTAVLYVVQRMESLSTLFMLLGLLAYLRGRVRLDAGRPGAWNWMVGGLVGGTLLAALAKESGVLLPAYAFVLEWVLFGLRVAKARRADRRLLFLFAGVLFVPGILGIAATLPEAISGASYAGRPFTLAERLMTEGRVMADYLRWIILPSLAEMGLYHDDYVVSRGWFSPASTLPFLLMLAGLLALAFRLRRRMPLAALGILFFLVGHSLVSTYLPLELVYEHRNYLPSLGIYLALFSLLLLEMRPGIWQLAGRTFAVGVIALGGFINFVRVGEWADPTRLAQVEAIRHPGSPRANYELGRALAARAKDAEDPVFSTAIRYFETAGSLPGGGLFPAQAIVLMSANLGRTVGDEPWRRMEAVVGEGPLASQDLSALHALITACSGPAPCPFDHQRLGGVLELAARKNPGHGVVHQLYAAYVIKIAHDPVRGLGLLQGVVAMAPRNPEYWKNLIAVQVALGRLHEAQTGIGYLRELNRFGNLDRMIAQLEATIQARRSGAVNPGTQPGQS